MIITPGVMVIMTAITVITMVMTIAAVIVIVVASVFMMSRAGSPFNFFDVSILVCHLYQFANGCRPLVVQLAMELLMPEPFGEGSDGLGISDVRNGVSYFRETPNKVT